MISPHEWGMYTACIALPLESRMLIVRLSGDTMTLPGSADTTSMLKDSVHSMALSVASVRVRHCGSLRAVRVTLSDEVGSKSFGNAARVDCKNVMPDRREEEPKGRCPRQ